MALADVYDALTTERPYKNIYSHEQAREIINQQRALHFDPIIIDSFEQIHEAFKKISGKNIQQRRIE